MTAPNLNGVYAVVKHDVDTTIVALLTDEMEADELAKAISDPDDGFQYVTAEVTYEPIYASAADANRDLELGLELPDEETG